MRLTPEDVLCTLAFSVFILTSPDLVIFRQAMHRLSFTVLMSLVSISTPPVKGLTSFPILHALS
jgi:hypothetical protein